MSLFTKLLKGVFLFYAFIVLMMFGLIMLLQLLFYSL